MRLVALLAAGIAGAAHHVGVIDLPRVAPLERAQQTVQQRQQSLVQRVTCQAAQLRALESGDPAALAAAPQRCG